VKLLANGELITTRDSTTGEGVVVGKVVVGRTTAVAAEEEEEE